MILRLATLACLMTAGCATTGKGRAVSETSSAPYDTPEGAAQVRRDLARWYIDNDMHGQALVMVRELREQGISGPDIDLMQGEALAAEGLLSEAEHVLLKVLEERPREVKALRALGIVYADQNRIDEAITLLGHAVELQPDDAATRNNLGFLHLVQEDCPAAIAQLQTVMDLDATQARYRNNLAMAQVCMGNPEEALRLLRSNLTEADARYNLGVAMERFDRLDGAKLQYEAATAADPQHALAQEAIARLNTPLSPPATDIP
ncbi:MAG: tetratricopeptide repeat protein [Myxococcota bacterium]